MPTIVGSSVGEWPNRYLLRWRASRKGEESNGNTIPINGFIIKYQYIWDTGEGQQVVKRISKDVVTFKSFVYGYYIENLHPDWSYKITVTTFNDFGESDESIPMYFVTAVDSTNTRTSSKEDTATNQPGRGICPQVGDTASLPSSRADMRPITNLLVFTLCLICSCQYIHI
ncbi:uncharacterized protein LOC117116328 [Anneissia japonica]|uniref:uncharacterized protein LOC117116328 n=1 Tax=Anneissia japonica TaxID=1529436 RepID=UPI00142554E8|nr:uncharacterized protein LOC117116328 [Anneissia japonica]